MIKSDVQVVHLNELPALLEDFFGLDYAPNRLGLPGQWGGSDLWLQGLKGRVQRQDLENLLTFRNRSGSFGPRQGWADGNPVIAQRLTLDARPDVTTMWALGSPAQREMIAKAHFYAVRQTMDLIHNLSLLESESVRPLLGRGCLSARFLQGAAEDQTPRLRTTVVIAQQYRLSNGHEVHFPLDVSPGTANDLFSRWEWRRLTDQVGALGLTRGTRVPTDLFSPPKLETLTKNGLVGTTFTTDRRLARGELFEAWRLQAGAKGFGPEQVQEVFQAAFRLGRSIRASWQIFTPDSVWALWDAASRAGAPQSQTAMAPRKPDRDHGHSL